MNRGSGQLSTVAKSVSGEDFLSHPSHQLGLGSGLGLEVGVSEAMATEVRRGALVFVRPDGSPSGVRRSVPVWAETERVA
eukprot:scaffold140045_cov35-Tisochrysis_lutea.AAC.1